MIEDQNKQIASISINEVILAQLRDLKEGQRDIRAEIKDVRQELNARIDKLSGKMDSSTNQGQIATISTIGIGVAAVSSTVALLYSLFSK